MPSPLGKQGVRHAWAFFPADDVSERQWAAMFAGPSGHDRKTLPSAEQSYLGASQHMLFRQQILDGIRSGTITLAFRRWRRPSVRAGGTLLTAVGELGIGAVDTIAPGRISAEDARRAGYGSREALLAELGMRDEGEVYRIELGPLRPDPRVALRQAPATAGEESRDLQERLRRLDARAADGPWTLRTLELLDAHPGVRAGDLCGRLGQEKEPFKINVRKLKTLGLTESLDTGYRLSARGQALLHALRSA
jgi:hypothetical protein